MIAHLYRKINEINTLYTNLDSQSDLIKSLCESNNTIYRLVILKYLVYQLYSITLHDTQLLTVLAMQDNYLVEVKTGEGKSLCVAINAILEYFNGKTTYVVTTNPYLSERDYIEFKPLFDIIGIPTAYNIQFSEITDLKVSAKQAIHDKRIIYSDCCELCFDYLRDVINLTEFVKFESVIVDEVDFILIDNATVTCNLVDGQAELSIQFLFYMNMCFSVIENLSYTRVYANEAKAYELWDVDCVVFESDNTVILTELGYATIKRLLNLDDDIDGYLDYVVSLALQVHYCLKNGQHYSIENDKCWTINQNNGRTTQGSNYSIDLQNAIECYNHLPLTPPPANNETISYQVFYKKFSNLFGLSGTLLDATTEFKDIFKLGILEIPTNRPCMRRDFKTRYFITNEHKLDNLLTLLNKLSITEPKLIICSDDNEALAISDYLSEYPHELLINKNLQDESRILGDAGKSSAITISTPILGRGTDIKLTSETINHGLTLISLCHFDNMRIDSQVRGRSGRQGLPGKSYFLCSLDDRLWSHSKYTKLESLRNLQQVDFYSIRYQESINTLRESLQDSIYQQNLITRYNQFVVSQICENFREKVKNLYKTGICTSELDKIIFYKYNMISGLEDSVDILSLIEKYKYHELFLDPDILDTLNELEFKFHFKQLDHVIENYMETLSLSPKSIEDLITNCHAYSYDYYMYYLKQYVLTNMVRSGCVDE